MLYLNNFETTLPINFEIQSALNKKNRVKCCKPTSVDLFGKCKKKIYSYIYLQ